MPIEAVVEAIYNSWWEDAEEQDESARWENLADDDSDRESAVKCAKAAFPVLVAALRSELAEAQARADENAAQAVEMFNCYRAAENAIARVREELKYSQPHDADWTTVQTVLTILAAGDAAPAVQQDEPRCICEMFVRQDCPCHGLESRSVPSGDAAQPSDDERPQCSRCREGDHSGRVGVRCTCLNRGCRCDVRVREASERVSRDVPDDEDAPIPMHANCPHDQLSPVLGQPDWSSCMKCGTLISDWPGPAADVPERSRSDE